MKLIVFEEYIQINGRYQLWQDGTIYDATQAKDIPQWIFEFRDFILKNHKKMNDGTICPECGAPIDNEYQCCSSDTCDYFA